jgi:hypothetical protein
MKNVTFSGNILTRFIKPSLLTLLFVSLFSAAPALASEITPKEAPAEIKYLGTVQGKPLFQVAFSNPTGQEVQLTLRDENGIVIYSDASKDKTYFRKLQFNEMEADKLKLTLTLRTKKESQTQSFEITKSTRTIEDVAVVAL